MYDPFYKLFEMAHIEESKFTFFVAFGMFNNKITYLVTPICYFRGRSSRLYREETEKPTMVWNYERRGTMRGVEAFVRLKHLGD